MYYENASSTTVTTYLANEFDTLGDTKTARQLTTFLYYCFLSTRQVI